MTTKVALDLNRRTLARQMAQQVDGLTLQLAAAAIDAFIDGVTTSLVSGGKVRLAGFGSFSVRYRKARQTRHPRTHQPVDIPAAYIPTFTPGSDLRQQVQYALMTASDSHDLTKEDSEAEIN